MVQGIPYDSPEGRAQCGAITALMHAAAYATSAEIAAEVGPFPRYEANREAMLRVVRNHRRAAYNAPPEEYEGLTIAPVGIDDAALPRLPARRPPARECDRMVELGEKHGYRNAQVTVHRADRHHRPGHGLRHHRRRAGLRPGEVQEAGRRRLLQDHQRLDPACPARASATRRSRSRTSSATAAAPARCKAARTSTAPASRPRASPTRCCSRIEAQLPGVFELPFAFNRWTLGDDFCSRTSSA